MKILYTLFFVCFGFFVNAQVTNSLGDFTFETLDISKDTICVDESISVSVNVFNSSADLQWSFGDGASITDADGFGPHQVSYTTSGTKTIELKITLLGQELILQKNVVVESVPDAKLTQEFSSGFASVFHYGLALKSYPLEDNQKGRWYIQSGATANTGFVGDITKEKVGFYNFDYTPKVVCREASNKSGTCVADKACVQLTRFNCFCPIEIERDLNVCISDTQFYLTENCCFNPVPEIGDTTYWTSQNNIDFEKTSLISIVTNIKKPGNYKFSFHFENSVLQQAKDYKGDFNVKVKNKTLNAKITSGDKVITCESSLNLTAQGGNPDEIYWSVTSGAATIIPSVDGLSAQVFAASTPQEIKVKFLVDNGVCLPSSDEVILDFLSVLPDVSAQSLEVSSVSTPVTLYGNPVPSFDDIFTASWLSNGEAIIDDEGVVTGLTDGENEFYYVLDHEVCGVTKDSVTIFVNSVTGIDKPARQLTKVYPSPVKDDLHIAFNEVPKDNVKVDIYDLIGNKVFTATYFPASLVTIDASAFMSGIYLVEVNTEGRSSQYRIVK